MSGETRILFSSSRGRFVKYEAETDETVVYDEVVSTRAKYEQHHDGPMVKVQARSPKLRRTVIAKGLDREKAKAAMKRGARVEAIA